MLFDNRQVYYNASELTFHDDVGRSMKNDTSINAACVVQEFIFNHPATATMQVGGYTLREGSEVYLCSRDNSCLPELLNIAVSIPRLIL